MTEEIIALAAHVLVVIFFTGLIGCPLMIIVSWVEMFYDCFTNDFILGISASPIGDGILE
jgi:hypothetical protein